MNLAKDFAARLRLEIERFGKSQVELSEMAGIHPVSLSKYLSGKRIPATEEVCRLAAAMGSDLNALLMGRPLAGLAAASGTSEAWRKVLTTFLKVPASVSDQTLERTVDLRCAEGRLARAESELIFARAELESAKAAVLDARLDELLTKGFLGKDGAQ